MTPNYDPTAETRAETAVAKVGDRERESSRIVTSQLWQKSGSCPGGTIPILRIENKSPLSNSSVREHGRKKKTRFSNQPTLGNNSENSYVLLANHSVCMLANPVLCEYCILCFLFSYDSVCP